MNTLSRTNLGLNQQTYQRLKAALRLNLRRQVFIGVCDNLVLRDRLAAQLQDDLLYRGNPSTPDAPHQALVRQTQGPSAQALRNYPRLVSLYLDVNNPDPLAGVAQWLTQHRGKTKRQRLPMPAFQLLGVEQLSRQPATIQWLFLNYLQGIERSLPALDSSLLIWIPRPWARMIPQSAPDFWRCRTAVFEFAGDPTPLTFTISPEPTYSPASQGEWSTSNSNSNQHSSPVHEPINEPSEQINESISEPIAEPVSESASEAINDPVSEPVNKDVQPTWRGDRPGVISLRNDDDFDDFDASLEDLISTAEFPPEDSLSEMPDVASLAGLAVPPGQTEMADVTATAEVAEMTMMTSDDDVNEITDQTSASPEGLNPTSNSTEPELLTDAEESFTADPPEESETSFAAETHEVIDTPDEPDLSEDIVTSEMTGEFEVADEPDLSEDVVTSEMPGEFEVADESDLPENTVTSEMTEATETSDKSAFPDEVATADTTGVSEISETSEITEEMYSSEDLEDPHMFDGAAESDSETFGDEEPTEEWTNTTPESTTEEDFSDDGPEHEEPTAEFHDVPQNSMPEEEYSEQELSTLSASVEPLEDNTFMSTPIGLTDGAEDGHNDEVLRSKSEIVDPSAINAIADIANIPPTDEPTADALDPEPLSPSLLSSDLPELDDVENGSFVAGAIGLDIPPLVGELDLDEPVTAFSQDDVPLDSELEDDLTVPIPKLLSELSDLTETDDTSSDEAEEEANNASTMAGLLLNADAVLADVNSDRDRPLTVQKDNEEAPIETPTDEALSETSAHAAVNEGFDNSYEYIEPLEPQGLDDKPQVVDDEPQDLNDAQDGSGSLADGEASIADLLALETGVAINSSTETDPDEEDVQLDANPQLDNQSDSQLDNQLDTKTLVESPVPTLFNLDSTDDSLLDLVDDASLLDTVDEDSLLEYYDFDQDAMVSISEPTEDTGQALTQDDSQALAQENGQVLEQDDFVQEEPASEPESTESMGQTPAQEATQDQGDRPSPIPAYTPASESNPLKSTMQDLSKLLHDSLESESVHDPNLRDEEMAINGEIDVDEEMDTDWGSEDSNVEARNTAQDSVEPNEFTEDNSVLGLTGFDVLDGLDRITDKLLNDDVDHEMNDNEDTGAELRAQFDHDEIQDVFPAVLLEGLASMKPRDTQSKSQNLASGPDAFEERQTHPSAHNGSDSVELEPDELDPDELGNELDPALDRPDDSEYIHSDLLLDDDVSTSVDVGALIQGLETGSVADEEDFSYSDPWTPQFLQPEEVTAGDNEASPFATVDGDDDALSIADASGEDLDTTYTVMDATVSAANTQAIEVVDNDADVLEPSVAAEEIEIADANAGFLTPDLFTSNDSDTAPQPLNLSPAQAQDKAPDFEFFDPSDPAVRPLLQRIADLQHQRSEKRILAEAYRNLGNLYRDRIEQQGDVSPQNLIRAMQAYKQVLYGIDDSQPMWAEVLNDMGNLCWLLSRGAPSPEQGLPHLLQAIQSYRMALTKIDPKVDAQTYPMVQNNLGAAYGDLARYQDPVVNLQNSIHAYQEALLYRSIDREPLRYASTQNNLGTTYWNLAQHVEPTENLKQAIASYSEALRLYRPDTDPLNYAMIQNNLGTTYWNLAQHEQSGDWLRLAIMAYETALKFRTLETNPSAFAATQNNLGTAYWHVATYVEEDAEEKLVALQHAIKAYDAALSAVEVLEYQQHPAPLNFDVLATHNNLGLVQYQISTEPDIQAIYSDNNGYLDQAMDHHLVALQGWQGRPELQQTALGCVIQTLQAIYNQKGLTAQNLALSKIPGHMLPEIMPKL